MMLSIITPTYNRGYCLPRIYELLCKYKNEIDFEWILVDDGSTDETMVLAQNWINEEIINFKYIKQINSGKTNALINGFKNISNSSYSVVLDSDDVLTKGFFDLCNSNLHGLEEKYIGIVGLKSDLKGNIIGTKFVLEEGDYIDIYFGKNKSLGDKLFIVRSNVYRESLVKSFRNEKLIPESVFYLNMKKYGSFMFSNAIIYEGDYLEDGLSFDSNSLAAKNIQGFVLEKNLLQFHLIYFKDLIINDIKYIVFSKAGDFSFFSILKKSNRKILTVFLYLPSIIVERNRIMNIKRKRKIVLINENCTDNR